MKKMKKVIVMFLLVSMIVLSFASCGNNAGNVSDISDNEVVSDVNVSEDAVSDTEENLPEETVTVRVAGMTGPTSIGMVKMISDSAKGESVGDYNFTIAGSADEITPLIVKGELDIAAVPANLASVLYSKTEKGVKIIAINNLGVLYVLDKNTGVKTVEDLKGKTIYATGKGSTPEYTLRYVLSKNNIDPDSDVTIEFKSEPAEIVALLKESDSGIAMLPQPFVTVAQTQVEGLETVLDMSDEWKKVNSESDTVTGVVIVRSEFAQNNPNAVKTFLEEYTASCAFVNENVEEAATLVEEAGIFKAAIAKKAIPFCNVTGTVGEEMKETVSGYLKVLFDLEPKAVGGTLPQDDFYYIAD